MTGVQTCALPILIPTLNGFTGQGPAQAATGTGATGANPTGTAAGGPAAATPGGKPAPPVDYAKVENMLRENKLEEAGKEADSLVSANPKDGKAWLMKGLILQKQGNLDDAATCFRQADGLKAPEAASALNQINTERVQPLMQDAEKLIASKA